jgi:non-ribosomal peptide synthetase component F
LASWTGRDDVVTGVVVNTRPATSGADRLVGLYLNTVPLRLRAAGAHPVVLAGAVLAAERRGAPYLAFPLARVEALLGRPAFDVVLNYTHFHVYRELDDPALPATTDWWVHGRPSFPFRVDVEVDGREAGDRVLVGFDPALIGPDRVGEYLRHLDDALTVAAR